MPVNGRSISFVTFLGVEGRGCDKTEIFSFFGGMRANFGEQASKCTALLFLYLRKNNFRKRRLNRLVSFDVRSVFVKCHTENFHSISDGVYAPSVYHEKLLRSERLHYDPMKAFFVASTT